MKFSSHLDVTQLRFAAFSSADIRRMSVARIVTPISFDILGNALPGGLYDPAMGPYAVNSDPCTTCGQSLYCPGHSGHIDLCMPTFNPVFIKTIYTLLRLTCLSCFKLQISEHVCLISELQLQLIDNGYEMEAQDLEIFKSEMVANSSENKIKIESGVYVHPKIAECMEIIERKKFNIEQVLPLASNYKTKNTEALRAAIVNSILSYTGRAKCIHCKAEMKKIKYSYKRLLMTIPKSEMINFYEQSLGEDDVRARDVKTSNKAIFADECCKYFRQLYDNHGQFLRLTYPLLQYCSKNVQYPTDVFFMDAVLVPSSIVRPANRLRDEITEHPQTLIYKNILKANSVLKAIMMNLKKNLEDINSDLINQSKAVFNDAIGNTPHEKLYNAWQALQTCVDQTWDVNMGKEQGGVGLKQIIEKKEGVIRMHMMGKRVNYAARTVITPDPNINVDEIGIPDVFSRKLTYPTPVTPWNVVELREMVINGPDVYPGANFIEDERGNIQMIPSSNIVKRKGMAKTLLTASDKSGLKIVHRHLQNGDILLLNRQPTLHRPSIMAHKARILKGEKTFRLHYSNCKAYNADFDGDEMNAHYPQNELARSEGYNLVNVANQYLVPKDGTPLGGLIQDHVISGVKLTTRGRFFNKEDYQKLVYIGLSHLRYEIKLLPPAIIKPFRLWSGKQVLSTIIMNVIPKNKKLINLKSTAKISDKAWQTEKERQWLAGGTPFQFNELSEAEVIIRNGELLVGVLDKTHYGATAYGLIHCMYELYGGNCSTQLLSSFSKLFTVFMQREGFTLGVHDILVLADADKKRKKIIKKCRMIGNTTAASALDLPETATIDEITMKMEDAYSKDSKFRTMLDRRYKTVLDTFTNSINGVCLPLGLLCKFPENNLQLMVGSGAKGSTVNTMQISSLLGQIELEGKRPPLMISGKSLPSFAIFETSPKSGGFIDGRFMTGIQPQDFFFHCMAGREGLIDTAVKTSRSGYLQRCLIKHLEGLNVNYDMTVRDSDNTVIQFLYGEDGMDISMSQFLKEKQLAFLDDNSEAIVNPELLEQVKDYADYDKMLRYIKKIKSWIKKHGKPLEKRRLSNFQQFSMEISSDLIVKNGEKISKKSGRRKKDEKICKLWMKADENQKCLYGKKCTPCPDPVNTKYNSNNCFGSIPEHIEQLINGYIKEHPERKRHITEVMCIKSIQSLVAPGEPVGLLAAQSIGEPSTQMTLNTFHFAGRGEMNVTLGIPRLREILMLASKNIKTPSMDIPFLQNKNTVVNAEKLRLKLIRVTVADVLESINISSELIIRPSRERSYTLRFNFLPKEAYDDTFAVTPKQILKYMTNSFFKIMFKAIMKAAAEKHTVIDIGPEKKKQSGDKSNTVDDEIDEREPENYFTSKGKKGTRAYDSSDDEQMDDGGDGDATDVKLKKKNQDENDYEEPDVDEEKEDANHVDADINGDDDGDGDAGNEMEEGTAEDVGDIIDNNTRIDDDINELNDTKIVLNTHESTESYSFDKQHYLWCEITFHLGMAYKNLDLSVILREVAKKAVIWEIPNIRRAITYQNKNEIILKTDGINIVEMFKYNKLLDLNRLHSNDIHAIAKTYGIEAATRVIAKEVQNVFNVYGITVDPRHLLLVADYMTFDGTFQPLSRRGMSTSASPLQQMSFESSLQFLQAATVAGRSDQLENPSSRIMVGQPCKSGTGAFSVFYDGSNFLKEFMMSD